MITVWGRPTSICTQRVLWALVEVGCEYELELASATMGEHGHVATGAPAYGVVDTSAYRRMNPNGTIPTIDDNGFVLWESNAILTYLACRYAPELVCDIDPRALGVATQWMAWTNEHLEPALHTLVMHLSRLPVEQRDADEVRQAVELIAPSLELLDAHLAERRFVGGERFGIGDIPAAAAAYRFSLCGHAGPTTPHIERWLRQLGARDGFAHHVARRELHF